MVQLLWMEEDPATEMESCVPQAQGARIRSDSCEPARRHIDRGYNSAANDDIENSEVKCTPIVPLTERVNFELIWVGFRLQ